MQALDLATVTRRSTPTRAGRRGPRPGVRAFLCRASPSPDPAPPGSSTSPALAEDAADHGLSRHRAPFARPTLFLTGARSDYVRPAAWPRIRALFPAARHVELAGAGHWLHADAGPVRRGSRGISRNLTLDARRNLAKSSAPCQRAGAKVAGVAQLVEHVIRNDGVGGSSPFSGTATLDHVVVLTE